MLSRFVASAVVMFVIGGFVLAGEYSGTITSISKDEVKFTTAGNKKEKKKGEEKTLKTKGLKITKEGDEVKLDDFIKQVDEAKESGKGKVKGVRAKLTTKGEGDDEVVTGIEVVKGKKGK
jgi:hypothetical protein